MNEYDYSVHKYGGSSAAAPEQAAAIFTSDPQRNQLAVVSAAGRLPGSKGTLKVTDYLRQLEIATDGADRVTSTGVQELVIEANRTAYSMLGEKILSEIVDEAYGLMQPERRSNGYTWIGEYMSARLFSELTGAILLSSGVRFQNGELAVGESLAAIQEGASPILQSGRQAIMPGFYGFNEELEPTTLSRGGSDITGVLSTAALSRSISGRWLHQNNTDRDGIMSGDPELIAGAKVISLTTHAETREQMHGTPDRNGVVHGDAIALAAYLGVQIQVRNTFNPDHPGTMIVSSRDSGQGRPVIAISGRSNIRALNIHDMGMATTPGYVDRYILGPAGERGMSVSSMPAGEDWIKVIFNGEVSTSDVQNLQQQILHEAARDARRVTAEVIENQGEVRLIGQDLTDPLTYTRTIGRVGTRLADAGFTMRELVSNEKSPGITLSVAGDGVPAIMQHLHTTEIEESVADG